MEKERGSGARKGGVRPRKETIGVVRKLRSVMRGNGCTLWNDGRTNRSETHHFILKSGVKARRKTESRVFLQRQSNLFWGKSIFGAGKRRRLKSASGEICVGTGKRG